MSVRKEKIDAAICAASELIAKLLDHGPLNAAQVGILISGGVQALVPDAKDFEIVARARVISSDLAVAQAIPKTQFPRSRKRRSAAPNPAQTPEEKESNS